MIPSTKIDQNIQLSWTTWPPELKIEISLPDTSLAKGHYIIFSSAMIRWAIQDPRALLFKCQI